MLEILTGSINRVLSVKHLSEDAPVTGNSEGEFSSSLANYRSHTGVDDCILADVYNHSLS